MKNTLFTSLVVILLNGFVFSQGQPESAMLTQRTIIKDTLGKVLKLSDCSEYINADGWVFQPEKNEQGKVLYFLLRKTTQTESKLLSDKTASTIQNEDIKSIKRGKFYIQSKDGSEIDIRRRRNKQIECIVNADGDKVKTKYRITWSDDTSYGLNPIGHQIENPSEEFRYKVVEITDDYYIVRVIGENYLGETIKVYFK